MVQRDINLLPKELKEQKQTEKVKTSLGNISMAIFGICAILAVLASVLLINFKLGSDKGTKDLARLQEKIKDLELVEGEANRLESKILSTSKIIAAKNKYSVLLTNFSKASPDEVVISSLTTFGDNKVSVSGTVQSYLVLSKFITSLMDPAIGGKVFGSADLTGASLDDVSGKIRFSMILYIKKDALK